MNRRKGGPKASRRGGKNPFKGRTVAARPANRRERAATSETEGPRWLTAALDAVSRHRATSEPLDRALDVVVRTHRLHRGDRQLAGNAAFAWARRRLDAENAVDEQVKRYGGVPPPRRARDAAAVLLALRWAGEEHEAPLPSALVDVLDAEPPARGLALPPWLAKELGTLDDAAALLAALAAPAPLGLALDRRHAAVPLLVEALGELGVEGRASALAPSGVRVDGRVPLSQLPGPLREAVWPMDEGSQAVVAALAPAPGERVLDLCAGGGGKMRLLESLEVELVAADVDPRRLQAARERSTGGTRFVVADARQPPFPEASFDRVLVDAPCSGTGTLRRAPDLLGRLTPEAVERFGELQQAILEAAAPLVRPGGRLVYATCSLLPRENDEVVNRAVQQLDGFKVTARRTLRPDREGCDGFFVAVLDRAP